MYTSSRVKPDRGKVPEWLTYVEGLTSHVQTSFTPVPVYLEVLPERLLHLSLETVPPVPP